MSSSHHPNGESSIASKAYESLDKQMLELHGEETAESRADAERIARALLEKADLPLLFRIHSHMVLGCSYKEDSDFLFHAQEAQRAVELLISQGGEITPFAKLLRRSAATIFEEAQESAASIAADGEDRGEKSSGNGAQSS